MMQGRQLAESTSSGKSSKNKYKHNNQNKVDSFPSKQIDFGRVINGPLEKAKELHLKKPEFVIPKNIKRDMSNEQELLTKYLNESHASSTKNSAVFAKMHQSNVKNHTIHISELMNSVSKTKRRTAGGSKERSVSGTRCKLGVVGIILYAYR